VEVARLFHDVKAEIETIALVESISQPRSGRYSTTTLNLDPSNIAKDNLADILPDFTELAY
jgi:hypothetical protein